MDLDRMIRELHARREHLDRMIVILEKLRNGASFQLPYKERTTRKPQGIKLMGYEERRKVSERMKKYWADRRAEESGHSE